MLGDPSKAKFELGWEPHITAQEMCREIVEEDHRAARRLALLKSITLSYRFHGKLANAMKKIFVAGHSGMVGSAISSTRKTADVLLVTRNRSELNLLNQSDVLEFMKADPDELF